MRQIVDFLTVSSEDIVFTPTVVGVNLAWKNGILGDVSLARVFVQREKENPCDSDHYTQQGEVWRELEQNRRLPEGKKARGYVSMGQHRNSDT